MQQPGENNVDSTALTRRMELQSHDSIIRFSDKYYLLDSSAVGVVVDSVVVSVVDSVVDVVPADTSEASVLILY